MKIRERARRLKQRLSPHLTPSEREFLREAEELLQEFATEEELFASVRAQARLTSEEEAFLSGITTSGRFTLEAVTRMYAGVKRLKSTPTG